MSAAVWGVLCGVLRDTGREGYCPTMRQELSQGPAKAVTNAPLLALAPPKKWLGPVHIICAIHDNFYPVSLKGAGQLQGRTAAHP
jgi:hypothetical protein